MRELIHYWSLTCLMKKLPCNVVVHVHYNGDFMRHLLLPKLNFICSQISMLLKFIGTEWPISNGLGNQKIWIKFQYKEGTKTFGLKTNLQQSLVAHEQLTSRLSVGSSWARVIPSSSGRASDLWFSKVSSSIPTFRSVTYQFYWAIR